MKRRRFNFPWRQPDIETGPIRLVSRRLYILPTRNGLVFSALLVGLLIASSNYNVSLGYLFTFLMAGVGMAGLFHSQRNLLGLILQPLPVVPVFAGETACFKLHLDNPDTRLHGALRWTKGPHMGSEADVPARSGVELELDLSQPRRGYHRVGPFTLASTWPLGFFRCWTVFALDWGVLVYPRPAPNPLPLPVSSGQGQGKSLDRSGEEEFSGLRGYQPGDALKRIAWKNMARGQPPQTKQFADLQGDALWLDWAAIPEQETEARLSRLTRWVLDAERTGRAWGLRMPGKTLTPGRGDDHLKQALETLARHGET
jgi:uncharacterized protein (DUF58 family)